MFLGFGISQTRFSARDVGGGEMIPAWRLGQPPLVRRSSWRPRETRIWATRRRVCGSKRLRGATKAEPANTHTHTRRGGYTETIGAKGGDGLRWRPCVDELSREKVRISSQTCYWKSVFDRLEVCARAQQLNNVAVVRATSAIFFSVVVVLVSSLSSSLLVSFRSSIRCRWRNATQAKSNVACALRVTLRCSSC